eukprot:TRINITY_DN15270_c0_g1_i1.p1 TRINITY_DN15270_c0_g1~~TRINITY_DN15270_c0_g1_i1.p1  ORF type:complete len:287 (-),score=70.04 TRINITY_DN15270_c0_g1_i1:86-907(-)
MEQPERKRILLVNDDGIDAPGLVELPRVLISHYDVRVVAPAVEKSAQSHSITIHNVLIVEKHLYGSPELANIFSYRVHGSPADCVKIALGKILEDWDPQLIISGINKGNNAGSNVSYSGTVAAAMEGVINRKKAIALSLDHPKTYPSKEDKWPYDMSARLALPIIDKIINQVIPEDFLLNINFPNCEENQVKGIKITKQGTSRFVEEFITQEFSAEKQIYFVKGRMQISDSEDIYDTVALRQGWMTITPLTRKVDIFQSEWVQNELKNWEKNF